MSREQQLPDVIGMELEKARKALQAAGIAIVAEHKTQPPGQAENATGCARVVRVRQVEGGVEIVYAYFGTAPRDAT